MPYRKNQSTKARNEARALSFVTAACALWEEGGLGGFTMAQVARNAGSSVGNLYFYFPDRDSLLSAVLSMRLEALDLAIAAAMDGPGRIHARLARALDTGIRGFLSDRKLCALCFGTTLPESCEAVVRDFLAKRLRRFLQAQSKRHYSPVFALACWHASIRDSLRAVMAGSLPADPVLLVKSLLRWNFLALGLDKATVRKVVSSVQGEGLRA